MKPSPFQVHKSWLIPTVLVLLVTVLADGVTAWFVPRPVRWCTLIAASLPLSMIFFVLLPMLREQNRKP